MSVGEILRVCVFVCVIWGEEVGVEGLKACVHVRAQLCACDHLTPTPCDTSTRGGQRSPIHKNSGPTALEVELSAYPVTSNGRNNQRHHSEERMHPAAGFREPFVNKNQTKYEKQFFEWMISIQKTVQFFPMP